MMNSTAISHMVPAFRPLLKSAGVCKQTRSNPSETYYASPCLLGPRTRHCNKIRHGNLASRNPRALEALSSSPIAFLPSAFTITVASAVMLFGPLPAEALKIPPEPLEDSATRCKISTLDKFAETRAKFSLEASSGAMDEALVDIRGCDFHGVDLSTKVFSGVLMDQSNLEGARLVGVEMSRAIARDANLSNVDFTDANAFSTVFDGSDLHGAQFENAILSSASFGKGINGQWANLEDAHFEGALLSSSDVSRVCQNPTLSVDVKKYELGCK